MKRRTYDWTAIIRKLKRTPGRYAHQLNDVPYRLVSRIQRRQHPDLRHPDGRIEVHVSARWYDPDVGAERCNLWLRWMPLPDTMMESQSAAVEPLDQ